MIDDPPREYRWCPPWLNTANAGYVLASIVVGFYLAGLWLLWPVIAS